MKTTTMIYNIILYYNIVRDYYARLHDVVHFFTKKIIYIIMCNA